MAARLRKLSLGLAAIAILAAQDPPSQPAYGYEVVSIHPAAPGETNSGFGPGAQGGMRARNVTALKALTFAYYVQDYQFEDVPGWARSERFEINFTPDQAETLPGRESSRVAIDGWISRQRQRLQAVLHDRFSLALRAETRELPIYSLTVAKNGHKLSAPEHPERGQSMNINRGQQIKARNATMKALTEVLSMVLRRPVHDDTGLQGAYDFEFEYAPESGGTAPGDLSERPSIFTAVTEKLGLRLQSKKGSVPIFVIERIERPGEN